MKNKLTPKQTLDVIKKEFSDIDFDNRSRKGVKVILRQMYGYFAYLNPNYSQQEIGSELAMNADHTTIHHSFKTVQNYINRNNKKAMPIYYRIEDAIKYGNKDHSLTLREEYEFHKNKAISLKEKIDAEENKHKELKIKVKEAQKKELKDTSKKVLNQIVSKSRYNSYLHNSLNKWLDTKQSTDLLECTKAIGFNHKENFNTFKNLHQSIL